MRSQPAAFSSVAKGAVSLSLTPSPGFSTRAIGLERKKEGVAYGTQTNRRSKEDMEQEAKEQRALAA